MGYRTKAITHIGFEIPESVEAAAMKPVVEEACYIALYAARQGSPLKDDAHLGQTRLRHDAVYGVLMANMFQERHPLVNAGIGADLASDGKAYVTASFMETTDPKFSGAFVPDVPHPSFLAIRLQEDENPIRSYESAQAYWRDYVKPYLDLLNVSTVTPQKKRELEHAQQEGWKGETGTAGCIVLDRYGNLAVGTTTGGLTNVPPGRISDVLTPAATYAWEDKEKRRKAAVSITGYGAKHVTANVAPRAVDAFVKYGRSPKTAVRDVFEDIESVGGFTGLIGIFVDGDDVEVVQKTNFSPTRNQRFMYAYSDGDEVHSFDL